MAAGNSAVHRILTDVQKILNADAVSGLSRRRGRRYAVTPEKINDISPSYVLVEAA